MLKKYHQDQLPNGLKIITVPMSVQSVTGMLMVGVGSRSEQDRVSGISHFLEHMAFKGTTKRPSALVISEEIDAIGAEHNAFTGKEFTGYYIKAGSGKLELVIDMLADMLQHSLLKPDEIERERGVITEEINMIEDNPGGKVTRTVENLLYKKSPLGRAIIGSKQSVAAISRTDLLNHLKDWYTPSNIALVVAGGVSHSQVTKLAASYLEGWKDKSSDIEPPPTIEKQTQPQILLEKKKTEQTHMIVAIRAFKRSDPRRHALSVLASLLGGGMSSRLFHEVRERRGLAYSIHAYTQRYNDAGYLAIKAGLDTKRLPEALKVVVSELDRVRTQKVPPKELLKAKEYLKGNFILRLEDSEEVASFYATNWLLEHKLYTPSQLLDDITSVTASDLKSVADDIIKNSNLNLATIGPVTDRQKLQKLLSF